MRSARARCLPSFKRVGGNPGEPDGPGSDDLNVSRGKMDVAAVPDFKRRQSVTNGEIGEFPRCRTLCAGWRNAGMLNLDQQRLRTRICRCPVTWLSLLRRQFLHEDTTSFSPVPLRGQPLLNRTFRVSPTSGQVVMGRGQVMSSVAANTISPEGGWSPGPSTDNCEPQGLGGLILDF